MQIIWEPYTAEIIGRLPPICTQGSHVWMCVVPLINFQLAEWHQPDRCLRQFGCRQFIPSAPSQLQNIHQLTLKGKTDERWQDLYAPVLEAWNHRLHYAIQGIPDRSPLSYNDDYMVWFRRKTKLFIDRENARIAAMVNFILVLQK